ncbi:MAG: hypothetical protein A2W91_19795 [Bacteroidetes bacterium GWF2_38_335]|nr:MAG: hypothetical protein A2W91_19795 [Bacteroidetes bacterium GWF2_38_335]OFY79266.1 MAG: hypothetical protein A2281_15860 [Bacteroidetes bacterium RIFOXYA12_FULL_38_20]HBS86461.1 integrase [Bacteroidales bacterium]
MPKARFNLKNAKQNDEQLIVMFFNYNLKRIKISLEEKVKPKFWNPKEQYVREVSDFPAYAEINSKIDKYRKLINECFEYFTDQLIDPYPEELKKEFNSRLNGRRPVAEENQPLRFFDALDRFIEKSVNRVANDTVKDYRALKKHLMGFEKKYRQILTFKNINYNFYMDFVDYLAYDVIKPDKGIGLSTNTIGKQIKNLKIFLRDCFKREIVTPFSLADFKSPSEYTETIYLNEDEISRISKLDLEKLGFPDYILYRDIFVLGCSTGLRYSDFERLGPDHIKNGFIHIRQKKVQKPVVIPLDANAEKILKKYENNLPSIDYFKFNVIVKELGRMAGIDEGVVITKKRGAVTKETTFKKYELIASHTCRRSFCTNQFMKGVPAQLIMRISGHKSEKNFLRYLKIDGKEAAEKMKEFWKLINKQPEKAD